MHPSSFEERRRDRRETIALLRRQDALYGRLESLATRQRTLVTGDDSGPLLALLADRQRLSKEIMDVSSELEPIRRDWPTSRACLDVAEQAEADGLLRRTEDRLRRVIESDEHDARLLSARRTLVRESLTRVQANGAAVQAYQDSRYSASRWDQTDEALR